MTEINPTYQRIYQVIKKIPKGRLATYGQIALLAGIGRQPRRVGYALNILPEDKKIPWHRVINAQGEISRRPEIGCMELQRTLLEKEGIIFDHHAQISLHRFQWKPKKCLPASIEKSSAISLLVC